MPGGQITANAGGLLLRELDQRYQIAEKAASCLRDPRDSGKAKHDLLTLVRQRLFAIPLDYEHSALGYRSPQEYKRLYQEQKLEKAA